MAGWLHKTFVRDRRTRVLTDHLFTLTGPEDRILDIGSGSGKIAADIHKRLPRTVITGIDILVQEDAFIDVSLYDGTHIPFPEKSFDTVLLVDVLHHTLDPGALLQEAVRVSKNKILIKDHFMENRLDYMTLKLMDNIGNSYLGIGSTYHYFSKRQWYDLFKTHGLAIEKINQKPGLYTFPLSLLFDRNLHFIASLKIS